MKSNPARPVPEFSGLGFFTGFWVPHVGHPTNRQRCEKISRNFAAASTATATACALLLLLRAGQSYYYESVLDVKTKIPPPYFLFSPFFRRHVRACASQMHVGQNDDHIIIIILEIATFKYLSLL